MGWLGSFFKLVIEVLARWFPVKSRSDRKRAKIEKKLKEIEDYKVFLENRLSVALIKKRGMQVAMLRAELRAVVADIIRLREEATRYFKPQ